MRNSTTSQSESIVHTPASLLRVRSGTAENITSKKPYQNSPRLLRPVPCDQSSAITPPPLTITEGAAPRPQLQTKVYKGVALSPNEEIRRTITINNVVYTEAKMESKRQSYGMQGPRRKIRKVVHLSPEVEQLLRSKDIAEARLLVRHEGNQVYVSIRPPVQPVAVQRFDMIQQQPRNESRPRPIRPAGR